MQTVLAYSHSHFTNILFFDVLFHKLGSSLTNERSGNNTPLEFYTFSIASCIQCSSVHISYTYIILLWQMHVHFEGCAVRMNQRPLIGVAH